MAQVILLEKVHSLGDLGQQVTVRNGYARNYLTELVLTIPVKSAEEGRLYGSIGIPELVRAADAVGITLEKSEIRLPNGPLRQLGEHEVAVQFHSDVIATLKINIVAEE